MRSGSANGRGARSTPLKMLNTAVVTPIPRAKATTASADTKRARSTDRVATLISWSMRDIPPLEPLRRGRPPARWLAVRSPSAVTPQTALPPFDRVVFETPSVRVGAFRCPPSHPSFADSGPIRDHCFVFPRTPVLIQHKDRRPFAADPTVVTLYN